jgi:hypothetical protein
MGSFMVYLAKWGVSQTPGIQLANRDPSYLFVYAPTSFHWRDLLLQGGKARFPGPEGTTEIRDLTVGDRIDQAVYDRYVNTIEWYNYLGVALVTFWLYLIFLLIIGFGYSYFWTASTIIYLLMRRKVDDAELDEVYLEEDDQELPYPPAPAPAAPAPAPAASGPSLTMVEPPTLRTPSPAPAPAPATAREEPASAAAPRPQPTPLPPVDRPASPPGDGGPTPPGESA